MAERIFNLPNINSERPVLGGTENVPRNSHRIRYRLLHPTPNAELNIATFVTDRPTDRQLRRTVRTAAIFDENGLINFVPVRFTRDMQLQERKEKSPLEAIILHNYFLSFKFSQGSEDLQKILIAAVSSFYNAEELRKEFGSIEELDKKLRPEVEKFRLPLNHALIDDNVPMEFNNRWNHQLHTLKPLFDGSERTVQTDIDDIMAIFLSKTPLAQDIEIATRIANCDMYYYDRGGRDNGEGKDPFESHVKRFLIDQEPTGSSEFNRLFQSVRAVTMRGFMYLLNSSEERHDITYSTLVQQLRHVQKEWLAKHPGKNFFDLVA